MTDGHALAPEPTFRLVPSLFPPIGLFDTVATAADLAAIMELAGWTDDRLVEERTRRLPKAEWAYGRPNSSIIMAAFLHVSPTGMRFNGPDLGAWYAADTLQTAAAEVGHHLRRETVARSVPTMTRRYHAYTAAIAGEYFDIRTGAAAPASVYAPDSYAASQPFGEALRAKGGAGILYDSVRFAGGENVAAFRPSKVLDVTQGSHFEIAVAAAARAINVSRL